MKRSMATLLTISLLAATAHGAEPNQPDWAKLAKHYVHDSLKLAPGERVLIHYDPAHSPALVAALRSEIVQSGGIISAELTWPSAEVAKYLDALSVEEKTRRAAAEDAIYRELFARSDVYLWIDLPTSRDPVWRRFEHLIGESKLRSIHSHWFESDDPTEHEKLFAIYERAIEIAPASLDAVLAPMETTLRGSTAHLTSPAGTDLSFKIPHNAWFNRNTGDASRAKVAHARSVRDREEELPAGVLRTTDVTATEGTLVASVFSALPADRVTVTFHEGRIVKVEPQGGIANEFAQWFNEATGDKDKVSELVIGANPELQPILPSGFMPYFGYGAGIIRIAVGDNWESGGPLRTGDHGDWWLFVIDGTLTAGDRAIIEHGALASN